MAGRHLSSQLLKLYLSGRIDAEALVQELLGHLVRNCPECRAAWLDAMSEEEASSGEGKILAFERKPPGGKRAEATSFDEVFRQAAVRVSQKRLLADPRPDPAELVKRLLEVAPEARVDQIRTYPDRYAYFEVAEFLLEHGSSIGTSQPALAIECLSLVDVVCQFGSDRSRERKDLEAKAAAVRGNAFRLQVEYIQARAEFSRAQRRLKEGTGDPVIEAEILSLHTSLLRDECRFDEADRACRRAAGIYRRLGNEHRAGRCMILQAMIERDLGYPERAKESLERAEELLDFEREPHLDLLVCNNLALYTAEAGKPEEALRILDRCPWQELTDPRQRLHGQWIRGLVERALGCFEDAAQALIAVREGFVELKDPRNYSMATLDLALLYASANRPQEVKHLAGQALAILQALDIPRDALSCLLIFVRAAEVERATVEVINQVHKTLSDTRSWLQKEVPS